MTSGETGTSTGLSLGGAAGIYRERGGRNEVKCDGSKLSHLYWNAKFVKNGNTKIVTKNSGINGRPLIFTLHFKSFRRNICRNLVAMVPIALVTKSTHPFDFDWKMWGRALARLAAAACDGGTNL